jgi:hypothetical protein
MHTVLAGANFGGVVFARCDVGSHNCVQCTLDSHCGLDSYCSSGRCIAGCNSDDSRCPVSLPHCLGNSCVVCSSDSHCPKATPRCAADHTCQSCHDSTSSGDSFCQSLRFDGCLGDGTCTSCVGTRWKVADKICVQCLSDVDCPNAAPVCNSNNKCVKCNDDTLISPLLKGDAFCKSKGFESCDSSSGSCGFCTNSHWQDSKKQCVECTTDSHCTDSSKLHCDLSANTCVNCVSDAQCPFATPYCSE